MYKIDKFNSFNIIHVEKKGIKISLLDYGATIYQLQTPDISNNYEDIVLRYNNLQDYYNNDIYLNTTIGPIAGRIKNGEIFTNNKSYILNKNFLSKHTLHSGELALSFKKFNYEINEDSSTTNIIFSYQANNKLNINYTIRVIYIISDYQVKIKYELNTLNDFYFNITNHAYFNLSGNLKRDIKNHVVQLNTKKRHLLDKDLITTNKISEDPLYDFSKAKPIKEALSKLENTDTGGLDDIYYFPNHNPNTPMAIVYEPISKRQMKVYSSYDHLVFYSHNNTDNKPLKHINKHPKHYGLCFECEKSPYGYDNNHASNPYLKIKQTYQEYITYKFGLYNE